MLLFFVFFIFIVSCISDLPNVVDYRGYSYNLPRTYDARSEAKYHEECQAVLNEIPRQSLKCGDCWAVSGALVLSQRYCILRKGKFTFSLSAKQLTQCKWLDRVMPEDMSGCHGGTGDHINILLNSYGVATGTTSSEVRGGCQTYDYSYCDKKQGMEPDCPRGKDDKLPAGPCNHETCDDRSNITVDMKTERGEMNVIEKTAPNVVELMKTEITLNGPILTFVCGVPMEKVKSGKFHIIRTTKECASDHMVTILGWGVELGVEYWIIANSRGKTRGVQGIYFVEMNKNTIQVEERASFPVFESQAPNAKHRLFRELLIDDQSHHCFSLVLVRKCPEGKRVQALGSELIDFGCFKRGSQEARRYHRHPSLLIEDGMDFLAVTRKELVHRSCEDETE